MNVSKNHCQKDWQLFFEMNEGCKVTCIKITDLVGSQNLFEIYHTSLPIKNSEYVVKKLWICVKKDVSKNVRHYIIDRTTSCIKLLKAEAFRNLFHSQYCWNLKQILKLEMLLYTKS